MGAVYELKDVNYNKVGCRMSDNHWLKPYIQKKHFCKPIGSKNNPNRQTSNGPCDKPELVPNVKNGAYEVCESTKAKKRCDLKLTLVMPPSAARNGYARMAKT